ncbi:MAG: peptide chain release factor N(5)-glutamine methyltransferase, partial [Candidatus Saccharibacteria bacterium]|nr:peptide chain release factor N(5)-glutamine methyltransferase [Candidatus Saccharibacteria bacterium]
MNVSSWLKESPIDHLDSELIVAFVLGKDRTFVHAHPEYVFTEVELSKIQDFATRRGAGEPLAYILGAKEFYGHNFRITRDTLIPRPETEALIDFAKTLNAQKILDAGTGSGCIAITLALEIPQTEIEAVDISPKALEIAQDNAKNLGAKVKFYQSDL